FPRQVRDRVTGNSLEIRRFRPHAARSRQAGPPGVDPAAEEGACRLTLLVRLGEVHSGGGAQSQAHPLAIPAEAPMAGLGAVESHAYLQAGARRIADLINLPARPQCLYARLGQSSDWVYASVAWVRHIPVARLCDFGVADAHLLVHNMPPNKSIHWLD